MGSHLLRSEEEPYSRMKFSQLLAASCLVVLASSAPQRRRNQNVNTKFFTGNSAIDSAAWGAALGAGTQYFANQVLNPSGAATEEAPGAATREQTPGFSLGTTTLLATVWSASSEASALLQSLTVFLEIRAVE